MPGQRHPSGPRLIRTNAPALVGVPARNISCQTVFVQELRFCHQEEMTNCPCLPRFQSNLGRTAGLLARQVPGLPTRQNYRPSRTTASTRLRSTLVRENRHGFRVTSAWRWLGSRSTESPASATCSRPSNWNLIVLVTAVTTAARANA